MDIQYEEGLTLTDALKMTGIVSTGGEAKVRIQSGEILLNGEIETRRKKKLRAGDVIEALGETIHICL